jgi:hypothetical protein
MRRLLSKIVQINCKFMEGSASRNLSSGGYQFLFWTLRRARETLAVLEKVLEAE